MKSFTFQCRHTYPSGFRLDAQFSATQGVTALFGPSGSGKSTILHIIAGLIRPEEGRVTLNDRTLVDTDERVWIPPEKRRIGMVFQDHLLFPHRTVAGNLSFGAARRARRGTAIDRVVAILELGDLLERYPATLSGGQQRRVAVGRAILRQGDLLMLDEPLSGIQDDLADRVGGFLKELLKERPIPMIFVSHDQVAVRSFADQAVVIEDGRVVAAGPTQTTLDRATISGLKAHPGPVNLLRVDQAHQSTGHAEGLVGGQRFYLPVQAAPSKTVYVHFAANEVVLGRGETTGISTRNKLHGRIVEVILPPSTDRAFVAVDVGQTVWAELTREAVGELGLRKGEQVVCMVKAKAVQMLQP